MTPEKRVKLEEDESPLDLSVEKNVKILTKPNDKVVAIINFKDQNNGLPSSKLDDKNINISEALLAIECRLTSNIDGICFSHPIDYIYNPIKYAFDVHSNYVKKYCKTKKKILFLGMNAGPFGMSQTGVPFGEINAVVNFLQISGSIEKPEREHPKRKITGFSCQRSEVSGKKFWCLFQKICDNPENFFRHSFVHNYCPIALMNSAGCNITPAELKGAERKCLEIFCDEALIDVVKLLGVEKIISIGRFTEKRARDVVTGAGLETDVLYIPHPSPRSPSTVNWVEKTEEKLRELNLLRFFTNEEN